MVSSSGAESARPLGQLFLPHEKINWRQSTAFFGVWLIALVGPFFTGISPAAIIVAVVLYFVRMFFVTGFLHRYFSHRAYKVSRTTQHVMALLSCTAVQKGPLWWAQLHRHHHDHSDKPEDIHSALWRAPRWYAILWSHFLWILCDKYHAVNLEEIRDFAKYPELVRLEKNTRFLWPPFILAALCYGFGAFLHHFYPALNTSGMQMLVVGFFTSTFFLHHGTYMINSWVHMVGKKRYRTGDESRNSLFAAIVTLGEGWHNNHHERMYWLNQAETRFELAFDWTYWIIYGASKIRIGSWRLVELLPGRTHKTPRPTTNLISS